MHVCEFLNYLGHFLENVINKMERTSVSVRWNCGRHFNGAAALFPYHFLGNKNLTDNGAYRKSLMALTLTLESRPIFARNFSTEYFFAY
jgi:hypothetical protein